MTEENRRPRVIPAGLRRCPECGLDRGKEVIAGSYRYDLLEIVRVSCVCTGIRCKRCGRPTYRPGSDFYEEDTGRVLHMPWFGQAIPCRACRSKKRRPRE